MKDRNLTVKLDAEFDKEVRVIAAQRDTSISPALITVVGERAQYKFFE